MHISEIQKRIQNAKEVDFGNVFSDSVELFKNVWVQGLVVVLLNMVLAIPVLFLVYIPLVIFGFVGVVSDLIAIDSYGYYDSYNQPDISLAFVFLTIPLLLFTIVAMSTVAFGLLAAFYRICKLKDLNEVGREDYFYFFRKPYLLKTVKLSAAFVGIMIVAYCLCFFPLIYACVPLYYMYVVYAFNPEKSVSEIIKLSFAIGNKKWLITFGLLFVTGFLSIVVGILMCFVGTYVTRTFMMLPTYLIYKDVVGFEDEEEGVAVIEDVKF